MIYGGMGFISIVGKYVNNQLEYFGRSALEANITSSDGCAEVSEGRLG